jgi:hypothetical protein
LKLDINYFFNTSLKASFDADFFADDSLGTDSVSLLIDEALLIFWNIELNEGTAPH